jgi:hypothetical protein
MRTAAYKVDVASDRRRRENVPRHILCFAVLAKRVSRWFLLEIFPPMTYAYGKENKNGKP